MSTIIRFSNNSFPTELSENIFSLLPPSPLASARRVNKTWQTVTNEILLRISLKNMGKSILGNFFSDAQLDRDSYYKETGALATLRARFTFLYIITSTKSLPGSLLKPQIDIENSFPDFFCNDNRVFEEPSKNYYNKIVKSKSQYRTFK